MTSRWISLSTGLFFLILGSLEMYLSQKLPGGLGLNAAEPGPGLFPMIVGAIMFIAASLHIVDSLRATPTIDAVATDDIINSAERTATVTVTGGNEAGSTVTLNGNPTVVESPTTWSYVLDATAIDAFGQGAETLTAIATDAAGNVGAAVSNTFSVDTVAPNAPSVAVSARTSSASPPPSKSARKPARLRSSTRRQRTSC